MKNRTEWTFSDAAQRVDFARIIRESDAAVFPMPAVLRVTIDAKNVVTVVHRETFERFIKHGQAEKVDKVLAAPRLPVDSLRVTSIKGDRCLAGLAGFDEDDVWVAVLGDFVGELSDRVTVKVEVF